MVTTLKEVLWLLPPGAAIAFLAVVASLITIVPFERLKPFRPLILFVILMSFSAEIAVLTHSRREQDASHAKETADLLKHFSFVEQTLNDLRLNATRAQRPESESSLTLKKRALDLSDELLQFLVSRQVAPGFGQGGYGEGGFGGTDTGAEAYQKQTVEMYAGTFQNRVAAMRDALAKQGLRDSQLDAEYKSPANAFSIRTIAERIGALAEKLPE